MDINTLSNQSRRKEFLQEIRLFIEYGVSEEQQQAALDNLLINEMNSIALVVLRDFYSRLPELREEAVKTVDRLVSRHGMYLLSVSTATYEYLYFFNGEQPVYLGEKKNGINDADVLSFFGYSSNDDFLKRVESGEVVVDGDAALPKVFCPACAVAQGELHLLGCPVEICPWCDGQLNYCNCRFEKLGVDEITEESEIDRLEIMLNDEGRVPFSAEHAPAYPEDPIDRDESK